MLSRTPIGAEVLRQSPRENARQEVRPVHARVEGHGESSMVAVLRDALDEAVNVRADGISISVKRCEDEGVVAHWGPAVHNPTAPTLFACVWVPPNSRGLLDARGDRLPVRRGQTVGLRLPLMEFAAHCSEVRVSLLARFASCKGPSRPLGPARSGCRSLHAASRSSQRGAQKGPPTSPSAGPSRPGACCRMLCALIRSSFARAPPLPSASRYSIQMRVITLLSSIPDETPMPSCWGHTIRGRQD